MLMVMGFQLHQAVSIILGGNSLLGVFFNKELTSFGLPLLQFLDDHHSIFTDDCAWSGRLLNVVTRFEPMSTRLQVASFLLNKVSWNDYCTMP